MENDILKVLKELNVLQKGHFLLPSGKHSNIYFQCAQLLKFPDKSEKVLETVVKRIEYSNLEFDIVLGPAIGGIIMSYELARQLKKPVIYIERKDGSMTLSEYCEIKRGQKVLIAEDVITSGKTVKESIKLVESLDGIVVGVACIVNKESIKIKQPVYSCINFNFKSYEYYDCPFCKESFPLQNGK